MIYEPIAIRIYPNPFADQLFIQTNLGNEFINWTVVDLLGKVVVKGKAENQSQFQIDLQHLEKGIYLLLLNDGKSQTKEIIIKTN
ncbi:MAG: T9SS type A sorting domain-containing protein [Sphingobacteriia bacterium]|nr:T9SS type A sorting domain-containing protein [Sphingobacteriia bacterium]